MKRTQRWSPDTCGCVCEMDWDDTLPTEAEQHIIANRIVKACPAHAQHTNPRAHFSAVLAHNRGINKKRTVDAEKAAVN